MSKTVSSLQIKKMHINLNTNTRTTKTPNLFRQQITKTTKRHKLIKLLLLKHSFSLHLIVGLLTHENQSVT